MLKSRDAIVVSVVALGASLLAPLVTSAADAQPFAQEIRTAFTTAAGLPSDTVRAVALASDGSVWAATAKGAARFDGRKWVVPSGCAGLDVRRLAVDDRGKAWGVGGPVLYEFDRLAGVRRHEPQPAVELDDVARAGDEVVVASVVGLGRAKLPRLRSILSKPLLGGDTKTGFTRLAAAADGSVAAATTDGVYLASAGAEWVELPVEDKSTRWLKPAIADLAFDAKGSLWAACRQGAARYDVKKKAWTLFTPSEGVPFVPLTAVAVGGDGSVWFGTSRGALRFDGKIWSYRAGLRWLPDDGVRDIVVADDGTAWIATAGGVSRIERRMMSFAEKAAHYEKIIDLRHRRVGHVIGANLAAPGDVSKVSHSDSDNDGLWTGMYAAGECFRYAATKDRDALKKARDAFRVMTRLHEVTGIKGFPARSVLPADGPDPNQHEGYSVEGQKRKQKRDHLWKVITPRWPKSADGKWYWKCDTSSDEIDGHYFFYGAYYDHVAQTPEEKAKARQIIVDMTDHIVENDFYLVDHDGKPTRWGMWNPQQLNNNVDWIDERGLNSLEMLAFLATAHHMSGDSKYLDVTRELVDKHHYAQNMLRQKITYLPWEINNSDDEMAFMCYYNLILYTEDEELLKLYRMSLRHNWMWERPERNPLFNFIYGACGSKQFDRKQAVDTLRRMPWEMIDWRMTNRHRLDIDLVGRGLRRRARTLADVPPILRPLGAHRKSPPYGVILADERYFGHWNHNPYTPDTGGKGQRESDGANFLLPYYLGLYHGYVR